MVTMTYDSLVAPKGTTGSLLNWIGYGKIDVITVLDEAQFLLWDLGLRVREMRTSFTFGLTVGQANVSLPARFLDPIGKIYDTTNATDYDQRNETDVLASRSYSPLSGSLGTNPFTTALGSTQVSVGLANHGINQGSTFSVLAATSANGLSFNSTFPVISVTDANDFVIETGDVNAAGATASGVDGGAVATYTANNLVAASPTRWAIWDEKIHFDTAIDVPASMRLLYFRQPLLLSTTNETNFLTTRYPRLLRQACNTAAADFMKDDVEYNKGLTALTALVQSTAMQDDLSRRGATIGTDTP